MMKFEELAGKTIAAATVMRHKEFDDKGNLKLEFTDGTTCVIVADYGCRTGNSKDEYPTFIYVSDDLDGLVPVDELGL